MVSPKVLILDTTNRCFSSPLPDCSSSLVILLFVPNVCYSSLSPGQPAFNFAHTRCEDFLINREVCAVEDTGEKKRDTCSRSRSTFARDRRRNKPLSDSYQLLFLSRQRFYAHQT